MNRNSRVETLVNSMKSFTKESYYREEVLPEALELQKEMIHSVFGETVDDLENLKIRDVESFLDQMNCQKGGIADDELKVFHDDCKEFVDFIKGQISGLRGERITFERIGTLKKSHILLTNVELEMNGVTTELDALVITNNGVHIVEIKNSNMNVFIDESGDYYRIGRFQNFDSSLGQKMELRKEMVKTILEASGIKNMAIETIVVFTNNRVRIENNCPSMKTTFLSRLPYLLAKGEEVYSQDSMDRIAELINKHKTSKSYPVKFDTEKFKHDFAEVKIKLEGEPDQGTKPCIREWFLNLVQEKLPRILKPAVAAIALSILKSIKY